MGREPHFSMWAGCYYHKVMGRESHNLSYLEIELVLRGMNSNSFSWLCFECLYTCGNFNFAQNYIFIKLAIIEVSRRLSQKNKFWHVEHISIKYNLVYSTKDMKYNFDSRDKSWCPVSNNYTRTCYENELITNQQWCNQSVVPRLKRIHVGMDQPQRRVTGERRRHRRAWMCFSIADQLISRTCM